MGEHIALDLARTPEPLQLLWRMPTLQERRRLYVGINGKGFVHTRPSTHLLVVAISRSDPGKTTSVIAPNLYSYVGPVLAASDKDDLYNSTALVRSALGTVWHYRPDGQDLLPGAKELRFSFVQACGGHWDTTVKVVTQIVAASGIADATPSQNSLHFINSARTLIAGLFYAANRLGLGLEEWVEVRLALQGSAGADEPAEVRRLPDLADALRKLGGKDDVFVGYQLLGIHKRPDDERGSVFSTAQQILEGLLTSSARESTENPNFDMAAFVAGRPLEFNRNLRLQDDNNEMRFAMKNGPPAGQFDTVYTTSSEESVAPLMAGFYTLCRIAAERHQRRNAHLFPQPVLFALDEMATAVPINDLPKWLPRGNTGILVIGILQDLHQAKEVWGEQAGRSFLSRFQNKLVLRGVLDKELAETLTYFAAEHWTEVEERSHSNTVGGERPTQSYTTNWKKERRPNLLPDEVGHGLEGYPDAGLYLPAGTTRHQWVTLTPWFRTAPWPQAVLREATRAWNTGRIGYPLPAFEHEGVPADIPHELHVYYKALRGRWESRMLP